MLSRIIKDPFICKYTTEYIKYIIECLLTHVNIQCTLCTKMFLYTNLRMASVYIGIL